MLLKGLNTTFKQRLAASSIFLKKCVSSAAISSVTSGFSMVSYPFPLQITLFQASFQMLRKRVVFFRHSRCEFFDKNKGFKCTFFQILKPFWHDHFHPHTIRKPVARCVPSETEEAVFTLADNQLTEADEYEFFEPGTEVRVEKMLEISGYSWKDWCKCRIHSGQKLKPWHSSRTIFLSATNENKLSKRYPV